MEILYCAKNRVRNSFFKPKKKTNYNLCIVSCLGQHYIP